MDKETQKKVYLVTELTEPSPATQTAPDVKTYDYPRFTRLPNPEIPYEEYRLVSRYCGDQPNMTRMDWMELAIIEKLHNDHLITDEHFNARRSEITSRPPRGLRKNTKNKQKII